VIGWLVPLFFLLCEPTHNQTLSTILPIPTSLTQGNVSGLRLRRAWSTQWIVWGMAACRYVGVLPFTSSALSMQWISCTSTQVQEYRCSTVSISVLIQFCQNEYCGMPPPWDKLVNLLPGAPKCAGVVVCCYCVVMETPHIPSVYIQPWSLIPDFVASGVSNEGPKSTMLCRAQLPRLINNTYKLQYLEYLWNFGSDWQCLNDMGEQVVIMYKQGESTKE